MALLSICSHCHARYSGHSLCPHCGSPDASAVYFYTDRRGLGDAAQTVAIGQSASGIAVGAAANAGWISVSAVPVIGAVIAGVGLALTAIFNRKGPQQKIATTQIVNALEPQLKKNLDGYLNGARTVADQQAALQNFDDAWAGLVQVCSEQKYGEPGQRCIHDRERGSTKGYDWFALYRDPIANDTPKPNVYADSSTMTAMIGGTAAPETFLEQYTIPLAAALALLAVVSGGN